MTPLSSCLYFLARALLVRFGRFKIFVNVFSVSAFVGKYIARLQLLEVGLGILGILA